jgi:flagellar motor switch protein FliN/FliY
MALKLAKQLEEALGQAMSSLTGQNFKVLVADETAASPASNEPFLWQQSFSAVEGPSFWLMAGKDLWESLGRMTMEAAGVDEVTDADCRSTWQEIVSQTMGGIASGITAELGREVTAASGEEIEAEPRNLSWTNFAAADEDGMNWFFKAAWAAELSGLGEVRLVERPGPPAPDRAVSRTFDLLLDVALPVSVSFGRTSLQIREVLKLNTGSIVELDRSVTDPVEVIVNDCVIARGEVVVVDGNYGVRISHLASRDERLRSGMAQAAPKTGERS